MRRHASVPTREGDRVTTLELFFDLAFVFAFTQLSRLMGERHDLVGVVEAMTILALLWWSWTSYGWLANLAHADRGWMSAVMLTAMGCVVIVGVTVLDAYRHDADLFAPLVFVGAYLAMRIIHALAFSAVSTPALRGRAFRTSAVSIGPTGALLIAGAIAGGAWQVALWLAAAAIEPVITQRMSAGVDFLVGSTAHFTERHGLIVILAIGESIIAIGTGVAGTPLRLSTLVAIGFALGIAAALWWAYFHRLAAVAESAMTDRADADRAHTARDAYTYLHLLIVAGIVLTALGVEEALADESGPLGWFPAAALGGGIAWYLAATVWFAWRVTGRMLRLRAFGSFVLLAAVPVLAALEPLSALAVAAVLVLAVVSAEGSHRLSRRCERTTPRPSDGGRIPPRVTGL